MRFQSKQNAIEMEEAFLHLMNQFRQINQKYGLMVTKEIKKIYVEQHQVLEHSKKQLARLENKL